MKPNETTLIQTTSLKPGYWNRLIKERQARPDFKINREVDAVSFYIEPQGKEQIITHYVDDHVALLYRYSDKEIVGIRIESFEKSFLPKYAELAQAWKLSQTNIEIKDFGDLTIAVTQTRFPVAKELSRVAEPIIKKRGVQLDPVVA